MSNATIPTADELRERFPFEPFMVKAREDFAAFHQTSSEAEFAYSLGFDGGATDSATDWFQRAVYEAAQTEVSDEPGTSRWFERYEFSSAISAAHRDELLAAAATARARSYTGWSRYSTGPIRFAD